MKIRLAKETDYNELALMKWEHGAEDDIDYGEHNLDGVDQKDFIEEFVSFLCAHREYEIVVAEDNGIVVSAMFVYLIPKLPKPNGNAKYIAYLTNVYTKKESKVICFRKNASYCLLGQVIIRSLGINAMALVEIMKYLSVHYARNKNGFANNL